MAHFLVGAAKRLVRRFIPASPQRAQDPAKFVAAILKTPNDMKVRGMVGRHLRDNFHAGLSPEVADLACKVALPRLIRIETASACNLRCQHCTTGVAYGSTDRRVMKMATFDRLLSQIRDVPTIQTAVLYLGGEPLLNKNHAVMCRRVKEETQILTTKFVTNAMLLNEDWCDQLATANVDVIGISMDGLSPEENDRIRVRANYETIRKNVHLLRSRLRDRGAKTKVELGNTQIRKAGDPPRAKVPEYLNRDFPDFRIISGYAMVWPGMTAEETGLPDLHIQKKTPRNFCDHPFDDLAVRANGDMILCCYDISGRHVMGNIDKDNILSVYQSPAYVEVRRAMIKQDKSAIPPICQRCVNFTGDRFVQN